MFFDFEKRKTVIAAARVQGLCQKYVSMDIALFSWKELKPRKFKKSAKKGFYLYENHFCSISKSKRKTSK